MTKRILRWIIAAEFAVQTNTAIFKEFDVPTPLHGATVWWFLVAAVVGAVIYLEFLKSVFGDAA